MTTSVKITKKHHKHLNNPFPSAPESLPLLRGKLVFNSETVPSPQNLSVGEDFELSWDTGTLSIYHRSHSHSPIWASVPSEAFVSAATVQTQVEESRGSFAFRDTSVDLVCHHQTIQDIKVIHNHFDLDSISETESQGGSSSNRSTQFPVVLVSGWLFNVSASACAKYWLLFEQKCSGQIGFQVKVGPPNFEFSGKAYKGFRTRRRLRPKGFVLFPSDSNAQRVQEFNRVCFTYSSEENERFYGFGEQFSYMEFKGKRVPIFVQEQGIGRGDQPITFAANLISYRAGGDWSTTYAPSPFYITSKMKSLYLEGYSYCVFDLTKQDRVQIQKIG